jgi:Flp pilus assembly protein TadD
MNAPRLDRLRDMVARFPEDPRARYFLAHELFRAEDWAGAAEHFAVFVQLSGGDDGAAYKSLGTSLDRLGRRGEAASAYERGIASAMSHGHDGLAGELRELLAALPG